MFNDYVIMLFASCNFNGMHKLLHLLACKMKELWTPQNRVTDQILIVSNNNNLKNKSSPCLITMSDKTKSYMQLLKEQQTFIIKCI